MMETAFAACVFDGHACAANAAIQHEDGFIHAINPNPEPAGPAHLIIPGLINAHDHARPRMSSFGAANMPLEKWILRSAFATPPDPYLAAAVSMARSARAGCVGMMVHYTRPSGTLPLVDEARAIARAAEDVGIRIAFALAVRDRNPLVYGDSAAILQRLQPDIRGTVEDMFIRPAMEPASYIDFVEDIHSAMAGDLIDVQFGPAGVQWCSRALLEAIARRSAETGRRVHMHLLETIYQRAWADAEFPQGIVTYLKEIGLLSNRLTLAHCTHARQEELEIIAESGTHIVTNFSSNLHLRSGIGPIAQAHKCGCSIAVGVDGLALDEDDDAIREMRLVHLAHGGIGFMQNWTQEEFLGFVTANGRKSLGAPGSGALTKGAPADFTVIDIESLDQDKIIPAKPLDLLFGRGNTGCVRDVVVSGKKIVADKIVTGVDLPAYEAELRKLFRLNVGKFDELQLAWRPLASKVEEWFSGAGCN